MKQFLTLKSTPEINPQLISEILGKRFPTYTVSVKNDSVKVKKNALVTGAIKTKHEAEQTIISVETLMPWWVWAIIGWLPYLIVKRGFVDEVFSALQRDIRLLYPNSISECYSPNYMIDWKNKTKFLSTISTVLLVWIMCSGYFMNDIWPVVNSMLFENNYDEYTNFYKLYSIKRFVPSFLWLIIGFKLIKLGKVTIKYSGILVILYALYGLLNNVLSIQHYYNMNIVNLSNSYIHFVSIINFLLMLVAGYFINRKNHNGPLRYVSIALIILSTAHFVSYIVQYIIFDINGILSNEDYSMSTRIQLYSYVKYGTSVVIYPFCYVAYILLCRAFHKLYKYPVI